MVPLLLLSVLTAHANASSSAVQGVAPTAGYGTLEGVVTSQVDGRGLPNVTVIVRSAPPAGVPSGVTTDAGRVDVTGRDGVFRFDELPPGLYSLDVIGQTPSGVAPGDQAWVWTQVASVVVAPGLTATEQVTLGPPPPAKVAPDT